MMPAAKPERAARGEIPFALGRLKLQKGQSQKGRGRPRGVKSPLTVNGLQPGANTLYAREPNKPLEKSGSHCQAQKGNERMSPLFKSGSPAEGKSPIVRTS